MRYHRRRAEKTRRKEERLTAYDRNMKVMGDYPRSYVHQNGLWHRVVQCWIAGVSPSGVRVYLQRRSYEKKTHPGKYDISSGGHVSAGERPDIAMVRELREETGIVMRADSLIHVGIVPEIAGTDHEIAYIYVSFQNDPPFRPGDEVIYMVSADLDEFYRLCTGQLDEIEIVPAIRTGPMTHERFLVSRADICIHRSFAEVAYPFIKDYTEPFLESYAGGPGKREVFRRY